MNNGDAALRLVFLTDGFKNDGKMRLNVSENQYFLCTIVFLNPEHNKIKNITIV